MIILEGIWIGKRFPKLVMAISYVQMLVSFEHVVAVWSANCSKKRTRYLVDRCINFFWKRFVCFRGSVGFGAVLEFRFRRRRIERYSFLDFVKSLQVDKKAGATLFGEALHIQWNIMK